MTLLVFFYLFASTGLLVASAGAPMASAGARVASSPRGGDLAPWEALPGCGGLLRGAGAPFRGLGTLSGGCGPSQGARASSRGVGPLPGGWSLFQGGGAAPGARRTSGKELELRGQANELPGTTWDAPRRAAGEGAPAAGEQRQVAALRDGAHTQAVRARTARLKAPPAELPERGQRGNAGFAEEAGESAGRRDHASREEDKE